MAGASGFLSLYLQGVEPESAQGSVELSAWGSAASGVYGTATLYALADSSGNAQSPLPLFLPGPDSDTVRGYLPLSAEGAAYHAAGDVTLYAHGPSGLQEGITLFAAGSGVNAGYVPFGSTLPLFIRRPASDAVSLFLLGPGTPCGSGLSLYAHGAFVVSSGVPLYASGTGAGRKDMTLMTRGW